MDLPSFSGGGKHAICHRLSQNQRRESRGVRCDAGISVDLWGGLSLSGVSLKDRFEGQSNNERLFIS